MEIESVYTDEQIRNIAEKLAEELRNIDSLLFSYLVKSEEYRRGPFGIMTLWSHQYNPLGRFPVEPDVLTMEQKTIVTKIVGKGMTEWGKNCDHPDTYCEECGKHFNQRADNGIQSFGYSGGRNLPPIIYFCSESCEKKYNKKRPPSPPPGSRSVERDWDLEQRMKNIRNHKF
jgi:hypothetical protein